jgi:dTDP-L-rhamnose 4-epimerase
VRALVTGGAGFVGSHVVDLLVEAGHQVTVLDRAPRPRWANEGASYVRADVRHQATWDDALARPFDAVFHQAARVGLGTDFADVTSYADDNDMGTAAMVAGLHRTGFGGRVVLASSMVVYGEGRYRCAAHGSVRAAPRLPARLDARQFEPPCPRCGGDLVAEAVTEDAPIDPRNVYAATKVHQEHLVAAYVRECGATAVALRYHNVYGPRMPRDTPYAGVASLFASSLAAGRPPRVYEDGRQTRDFVHVTDVARANVAAAGAQVDEGFLAVNVCSGTPRTVGQLAGALWEAAGCRPESRPVVTGAWRAGDVRHVFASPELAARRLGFRAATDLVAGLRG